MSDSQNAVNDELSTIIRFTVFESLNYTCTDDQRMRGSSFPATLQGLAQALDRATRDGIERRGYSGTGAGAWVEAEFDADDDSLNVEIGSLSSRILTLCEPLPDGDKSPLAMIRWVGRFERAQVWDGHNHVCVRSEHVRALFGRDDA